MNIIIGILALIFWTVVLIFQNKKVKSLERNISRLNSQIDEPEELKLSKLLNYLRESGKLKPHPESNIQIIKQYKNHE